MQQKKSCASIYHDMQKGIYYKIDKQTGSVQRSHKNGSPLKVFKLDISGNHYTKRREFQQSPTRPLKRKTYHAKLQPIQAVSQKVFNPHYDQKHGKNTLIPQERSNVSSHRMKSQESEPNFLTNFHPSGQQPSEMVRQNHISSILKNFQKINEDKIYENHCSLDKNAGTILSSTILPNNKGFRQTRNTLYKPLQAPKRRRQIKTIPSSSASEQGKVILLKQVSKQRKIFLQFHPDMQQRQNPRVLNEQVQRKKNIKKLQELFLQQTSKITNQIYPYSNNT